MRQGKGRIFRSGTAYTMYLSIPADIVKDGAFPFDREKGQPVVVHIEDGKLVVSKS